MSEKDSAQNVIDSYRKRQSMAQKAPVIFGVAALLLVVGAGILIFWLANPGKQPIALFASPTPTVTITSTSTSTPTSTPTSTVTPTNQPTNTLEPTVTSTAAGPFVYMVQEGDTLYGIAQKFNVDVLVLMNMNPTIKPETLRPNQEVIIPGADTKLPTATMVPAGFKGTIDYTVAQGDTLWSIADKFMSTPDAILTANKDKLKTINDVVQVGWVLKVPVNIATPVPTRTPNLTTTALPHLATNTAAPTSTPTPKP